MVHCFFFFCSVWARELVSRYACWNKLCKYVDVYKKKKALKIKFKHLRVKLSCLLICPLSKNKGRLKDKLGNKIACSSESKFLQNCQHCSKQVYFILYSTNSIDLGVKLVVQVQEKTTHETWASLLMPDYKVSVGGSKRSFWRIWNATQLDEYLQWTLNISPKVSRQRRKRGKKKN